MWHCAGLRTNYSLLPLVLGVLTVTAGLRVCKTEGDFTSQCEIWHEAAGWHSWSERGWCWCVFKIFSTWPRGGGNPGFFFFNKYEILCFYQTLGCEQTSKYGRGRDMSVSKATFKQSSDQVTPAGHMTTACALVMWPPNATWSHSFPESDKESVIVLPPWGMRGVREYNKFSVSKEITREKHCLVPSHKMDLCFHV